MGLDPTDLMDYSMPNAGARFKAAVRRLGLDGDAYEKTFIPVQNALTRYPNFARPGAYLAIILVSDAPEQSRMSVQDFLKVLVAAKGDLKHVLFYGFMAPRDWCPMSADDEWYWRGSPFEELLTHVGGAAYKLCDPQFGRNLSNLGSNLAKAVTIPRIFLDQRPRVASLKVMYHGQEIPGGPKGFWTYNYSANAIELNDLSFAPGDNESVRVLYDIDDGIER